MLADQTTSKGPTNRPTRDSAGRFIRKATTTLSLSPRLTLDNLTPLSGSIPSSSQFDITRPPSSQSGFELVSTSQIHTPFEITPPISPVNQPPTTPRIPTTAENEMSSEQVAPFHGDKDDENPEDFLRSFFRRMGTNTDDVKKQQFPNFLQADSVADEWFDELPANDKSNWANIETAFRKRWPRKQQAKKTTEEYEEEITGLTLEMENLGKKEKVSGRDVYTHIAWADKMAIIVRGAKLEATATYIGQVRKKLPKLLREKAGAGHANWTNFLQAVRDIDTDHIREGVDIWQKEQAEQDAIKRRIQQLEKLTAASPTAPLRHQLAAFNIGSRPPSPTPASRRAHTNPSNLFQNVGNSRNAPPSIIQPRPTTSAFTPRPPPTQADKTAIIAQLQKYPHHPNSDAGRQAHQAQQNEWMKTHGLGTRVTESTPYPLRPGMAPVNSGECFTCGYTGHIGRRDGGNCGDRRPLHPNEQTWRAICSRILKDQRKTVNIQLVAVDDYGTVWEDTQGNGEGPSL